MKHINRINLVKTGLLTLTFAGLLSGVAAAGAQFSLSGRGPVSQTITPGTTTLTVDFRNNSEINMGADIYDSFGNHVYGKTLTTKGVARASIQTIGTRSYTIKMHCNDPNPLDRGKCRAQAIWAEGSDQTSDQNCRVDVRSKPIGIGRIHSVGVPMIAQGVGPLTPLQVKSIHTPKYYHLFVVYYNQQRRPFYFRGGPTLGGLFGASADSSGASGSPSSGSGSSLSASSSSSSASSSISRGCFSSRPPNHPHGNPILAECGEYKPGTPDWSPGAPSVTVLTGTAACPAYKCLIGEVKRINDLHRGYDKWEPNSNSVARTFLQKCKLPENKPAGNEPGWRTIL